MAETPLGMSEALRATETLVTYQPSSPSVPEMAPELAGAVVSIEMATDWIVSELPARSVAKKSRRWRPSPRVKGPA